MLVPNKAYKCKESCFEFLSTLKSTRCPQTIFHTYWRNVHSFDEKNDILLQSYVSTQNLRKTKLILWSPDNLEEKVEKYKPYIQFKYYDVSREAKKTKHFKGIDLKSIQDSRCWSDSDLFRQIILHNYGGVFFDADMIFVRDLSPILKGEWLYQRKADRKSKNNNNAVLKVNKGSNVSHFALECMEKTILSGARINNTNKLGRWIYNTVLGKFSEFTSYPVWFFDVQWMETEKDIVGNIPKEEWQEHYDNGFIIWPNISIWHNETAIENLNPKYHDHFHQWRQQLYPETFTYHWHNGWDHTIEEGCKIDLYRKCFI